MSEKSIVRDLVQEVEGFLTDKDGCLLFDLAQEVKGDGAVVEIGSWKGRSTIWLAKGSGKGKRVKVFAVDHHTGSPEHRVGSEGIRTFEEFKANIERAQVVDLVVPIVKASVEGSAGFKDPIELLFIDGAHDYDSVKQDYESWSPKVIDGGVIAFHDSEFEGVSRFLEELVRRENRIKFVAFGGSIACLRKGKEISAIGRIRNRQLAKVTRLRGELGWRKKKASPALKPLYNLMRNLAKAYRFLLVRLG